MEAKQVNRATFNNFRKKLEGEIIEPGMFEVEDEAETPEIGAQD